MEVPQPVSDAPLPIECRLALGRRELRRNPGIVLQRKIRYSRVGASSRYQWLVCLWARATTWRAYIALSREYYTIKNIVYSVRRETLSRVFCFDPRPMRRNWLNPQEEVA